MSDYEPGVRPKISSKIPVVNPPDITFPPLGTTGGDLADRHNTGKPRPSLIPVEFVEELLTVLEKGAQKYEKNNWKKGQKTTTVLDSLERHLIEFKKGIDVDPDDGLSTLTKIAVNALFLRFYQLKGMSHLDDREK
jgi:Domain of unknown function (DUF5664)